MAQNEQRKQLDVQDRIHMDHRVKEICGLAISEMQYMNRRIQLYNVTQYVLRTLFERCLFNPESNLAEILTAIERNTGLFPKGDCAIAWDLLVHLWQRERLTYGDVIFNISDVIENQRNYLESEIDEFIDIDLGFWESVLPSPQLQQKTQ